MRAGLSQITHVNRRIWAQLDLGAQDWAALTGSDVADALDVEFLRG